MDLFPRLGNRLPQLEYLSHPQFTNSQSFKTQNRSPGCPFSYITRSTAPVYTITPTWTATIAYLLYSYYIFPCASSLTEPKISMKEGATMTKTEPGIE